MYILCINRIFNLFHKLFLHNYKKCAIVFLAIEDYIFSYTDTREASRDERCRVTIQKGGYSIMKEKVVLAYSGGLDTTAIIPWLKENFDYEVICCCIN